MTTAGLDDLGGLLKRAIGEAIADFSPAKLVEEALPALPPRRARVRVVAIGKAAAAMTRGAFARWGDRIEDALVVTHAVAPIPPRTSLFVAGHPLPDERSLAAAEEALRRAGELDAGDVLCALISGGASALVSAPRAGLSLGEKRGVVKALLDAGAPIQDVNVVRRHLSRVKGGRLAARTRGARVLTLYLSDVIDGAVHDVGSGPTVLDPTTIADALAALKRWAPDLVTAIQPLLDESAKPGPNAPRTRAKELATPDAFAHGLARRLNEMGMRAAADPPEIGEVMAMVKHRVARSASLAPGEAIVIACEPTLALPTRRGRGGRAGRVALLAAGDLPTEVVLLCAATDGVDGSSGHAGAIVTRSHAENLAPEMMKAALDAYDDAAAHEAMGTALDLGPTENNLADVHILARLR